MLPSAEPSYTRNQTRRQNNGTFKRAYQVLVDEATRPILQVLAGVGEREPGLEEHRLRVDQRDLVDSGINGHVLCVSLSSESTRGTHGSRDKVLEGDVLQADTSASVVHLVADDGLIVAPGDGAGATIRGQPVRTQLHTDVRLQGKLA
jgi:hypothetical protein